jgi:hypothetical protein
MKKPIQNIYILSQDILTYIILGSQVFYVSPLSLLIYNFVFPGRSLFAGNVSVGLGGVHWYIHPKFRENRPAAGKLQMGA